MVESSPSLPGTCAWCLSSVFEFRCVLPHDDFVFQFGTWTHKITPFKRPFTLICPPNTFIGGMSARFLGVDSLWDILCNHLPEGSELGGCNWTDSLNILHENLTLPTLREKMVIGGVKSIFARNLCVVFVFRLFSFLDTRLS